jgi:hypothetical protein
MLVENCQQWEGFTLQVDTLQKGSIQTRGTNLEVSEFGFFLSIAYFSLTFRVPESHYSRHSSPFVVSLSSPNNLFVAFNALCPKWIVQSSHSGRYVCMHFPSHPNPSP